MEGAAAGGWTGVALRAVVCSSGRAAGAPVAAMGGEVTMGGEFAIGDAAGGVVPALGPGAAGDEPAGPGVSAPARDAGAVAVADRGCPVASSRAISARSSSTLAR